MKIASAALAGAILLATSVPSLAQAAAPPVAPAPAATADDAAKLAQAHAVVDIIYPPATRQQMMDKMLSQVMAPVRQNMPMEDLKDPGLKALFKDYFDSMFATQRALLEKHLPDLTDAMATAYADQMTLPQLTDLHAFADTPSGRAFFAHATTILGDPAMQKVLGGMMADAREATKASIGDFKAKVAAYVKAHPKAGEELKALDESKGKAGASGS